MTYNPSPEVAVARDAAKRLSDASMCIVLWVDKTGEHLGCASYGKTRVLCDHARGIADVAYEAAMKHITGP
jgi:hypothetical protein